MNTNRFLDEYIGKADQSYLSFEAVKTKIDIENLKTRFELMYGVELKTEIAPLKDKKTGKFYGMGIADLILKD